MVTGKIPLKQIEALIRTRVMGEDPAADGKRGELSGHEHYII